MKRILLLQLSLLISLLAQAWTYPRDNSLLDGLSYDIASGNKSAKVLKHPTGKYSGVVTIPASIMVTIKDGEEPVEVPVTEINGGAFSGCEGLKEIHIPASVTKIWKEAFAGCSSLTEVHMESIAQACTTQYEQANANPLSAGKHLYINGKEVTDLQIPTSVTSIGQYAFANCEGITSVTIPASVTRIGKDAFSGCKNLATSTFATVESLCKTDFGSLTANPLYLTHKINAGGKTDITTLSIPAASIRTVDGVPTIGGYILAGATGLLNVTIPAGVQKIGPSAFKDCTGLQTVNFPTMSAMTGIEDYADEAANPLYYASTLLINSVITTAIEVDNAGDNAYPNCKWLKKVTFREGVTAIGKNAFSGCTNLEEIVLPTKLTTIGLYAFRGCQNLKDFSMPASLKSIGTEAFRDCKSLTKVNVPNGCELDFGVFRYCSRLKEAILPASLSIISESLFEYCSSLTTVEMPGATSIKNKAFYYCTQLATFPLSNRLASIGTNAFVHCEGLTTLNLADKGSVSNIGASAFEGCSGLTALTLPATLVTLGSNAFKGCSALTQVFCEATTAPGIEGTAFGGAEAGMTLYAPEGATGYDSTTPWKNFKTGGTIKETTMTFYVNDAEIGHITQKAGTAVGEESHPKVPLSAGEAFMGWSADIPQTMPNEDMAFYGYKSINADIDGYNYTLYPAEQKNGKNLQPRATLMKIVKQLNENEGEQTLKDQVNYGNKTYPVTVIASKAFEGNSIISILTLPSTLQSIEAEAFKGCSGLMKVQQFPSNVTQIANGLFENCSSLTTIFTGNATQSALPDDIKQIGKSAFKGCGSLRLAKLPACLDEIDEQAFMGSGLDELTMPASVKTLGIEVFRECGNLEKVVFEEGTAMTILTDRTFLNCRKLKDVTLRGTTSTLGKSIFEGCTSLTNVFLPEGVSTISQQAFKGCTALTSVVLPTSVDYVGTKVFEASDSIKQVTVLRADKAPFAVNDAFDAVVYEKALLYVPDVTKYAEADMWKKFANKVARREYKLTYVLDGVAYKEIIMTAGDEVTAEAAPKDCVFSGWEGVPDVMPAKDVTVTGRRQYLIKYYNGTKDEAHRLLKDEEFAFFYGDNITIPVETLQRPDQKFRLTGLLDNNAVVEQEKVAEFQRTMPARDLDVIVNYQYSEQELTMDGITYKVFIMDNYAEVVKGDADKETATIRNTVPYTVDGKSKSYPVTVIGANAFHNFKKLKNVTLPDNLTTIADYAFCYCTQLTSVTLPAKLESIGTKAFDHCQKLTEITIPASVKQMGSEVFVWCSQLTNVKLDAAISTLPERTFQNCLNLADIEIPSQITNIDNYAFEGCSNLDQLTLKSGLKRIGDAAFKGCSKIQELKLPASVETIGGYAFYEVFGEGDAIVVEGTLPSAQSTTFDDNAYQNATLRTNANPVDTTPWGGFSNYEPLSGQASGMPQCATPDITYKGGKLTITCATAGATVYSEVSVADNRKYTDEKEIELSKTYVVTAYAKKPGMLKSQTATLNILNGDVDGNGKINTADATAILKMLVQ